MSSRRLLLVRHGVTDWNREGRFQGHLDPPLSRGGHDEARLLARRLTADASLRPARVVTSSLSRAHETARVVADASGASLVADARLIEVGQGEWEGRTHAELLASDTLRYEAWRSGDGEPQPPGAEALEAVRGRVTAAIGDLFADDGPWPVCIVSHGGTLRLLAREVLDFSAPRAWALDLDNASLSVLGRLEDGAWRMERWNDTRHLLGRVPTHVDESEGRPLAL